MELFGSSYALHDSSDTRLIGGFGSVTDRNAAGMIKASFFQEPDVFALEVDATRVSLVARWDIAMKLSSILQILVAQNRLLRGEPIAASRQLPRDTQTFVLEGGARRTPISFSWDPGTRLVRHRFLDGTMTGQIELEIAEEAAEELALALIERCATVGIASRLE